MFGYVRALRDDLTVRQDTLYRAAYCGLCKEMGRCTGQCSRMTLSYDMVFLYLVRAALTSTRPHAKKGRCLLHPFRARPMLVQDAELSYAARVSALLAYGKLEDDLADETGIKHFCKQALAPLLRSAKKRADLPELYDCMQTHLHELSALEKQRPASVDGPAEIFGKLLGEIFMYGLPPNAAKIAREIGFRVGRFIYAVDAADDMDEDIQKKNYNPFLLLYGDRINGEQKHYIEMAMQYDLSAASAALDLSEENDLTPIIRNILHLGMPASAKKALHKKEQQSEQESI